MLYILYKLRKVAGCFLKRSQEIDQIHTIVVKDPSQLLIILVTQTHTSGQCGSRDRQSTQNWA